MIATFYYTAYIVVSCDYIYYSFSKSAFYWHNKFYSCKGSLLYVLSIENKGLNKICCNSKVGPSGFYTHVVQRNENIYRF